MNKQTKIVVAVIVLVIISGLAYVFSTRSENDDNAVITPTVEEKPADKDTITTMPLVEKGRYADYVDESSVQVSGTKLLFFHASWCPQCRELDKSISSSALPDNLVVLKVDYDSNQALRQKYGVTIQTTIVKINDSGEKIKSYVAYEEPSFAAVQKALLP